MTEERQCRNCRWFSPENAKDNWDEGECRRYPPVHVDKVYCASPFLEGGLPSEFPCVQGDWWCGEWEKTDE